MSDKKTILLVEDDERIRTMANHMLNALGYEVLSAVDGLDGVEKYKLHQDAVDIVVLDMKMPNMNGLEACRAIKDINSAQAIVLATGCDEEEHSEEMSSLGVKRFLQKPFRVAELKQTLAQVLED